MSITETTSIGWGSRLMESIKGVIVGLVLFLAAFIVLFWNEGRAVKTHKGLQEGASSVVSVSADKVDATNEGKLVHLTGEAITEETLTDPMFNVSVTAIKLSRSVEMFQWKETKKTKSKKKVGGGKTKTTTYDYEKVWSGSAISSTNFKEKTGHQNPGDLPYESTTFQADDVTVGAFTLSPSLVSKMSGWSKVPVSATELPNATIVESGTVYIGTGSVSNPQIGDVKVSFESVDPGVVSIVSKQVSETFSAFNTSQGTTIDMLTEGTATADDMFTAAEAANNTMTWILRLVGFVMMFAGLMAIFKPLTVVADVIPLFGNLLGLGLGIFSGILSIGLSFITIAIAWIFYRPLIGIILLVLAVGLIGFFTYLGIQKKKKKQAAEA